MSHTTRTRSGFRHVAAMIAASACLAAWPVPAPRASAQSAPARPAEDALTAEVRVSDATVYEGQRFRLQISIEGSDAPEQPDLSHLQDFEVHFVSASTNNRSSVIIINGRMQQSETRGFVYSYDLVPKRTGVLTIPAVTVRDGARRATTQALAIRVNPPGESADVRVRFVLDPPAPYIGQPTTLRVTLLLNAHIRDVSFNFRGLDDLFTVPPLRAQGQALRQQGIELLGDIVPWAQGQELVEGVPMTTYTAERVIIPRRPGEGEIALTLSGSTITRPGDGFFTRELTAPIAVRGNTVQVTVRDLPAQGRPRNFSGLVGPFTVSASADPISVNVGDPITLRVTVNGAGPMDRVPRPDLRALLGDKFRVPDDMASPELRAGQVTFNQTVRPTSPDAKEIPPVEYTYFDPATGAYGTARSNPIPLRVAGTRIITSSDAVASTPNALAAPTLREREGGISANIDAPSILADQRFDLDRAWRSPGVLALAGGPAVVYGAAALVFAFRKARSGSPAASRRRRAHATALAALHAADDRDAHAAIARALTGYVADRFDLPAAGLTAREAEERLRPIDPDGASAFRTVLERCDAARFAGLASGELDELRAAAEAALERIERAGRAAEGGTR